MLRPSILALVVVWLFGTPSAFADFNSDLNKLDALKREAVTSGSPRKAGQYSEQIGDLYVASNKGNVKAADAYTAAGEYYAEAARGSSQATTQTTQYNAALAAYRKAKEQYLAAHAATKVALHQDQANDTQAAIDALVKEMEGKKIRVDAPKPPAMKKEAAPGKPFDPATRVPYGGATEEIVFDLAKHHFAVSLPTVFEHSKKLVAVQKVLRSPIKTGALDKARGVLVTNYLVSASMNQLDKNPDTTCSTPVTRVKKEKFLLGGKVPACFTTSIVVGYSPLTKADAVMAMFHVHFELEKLNYRLMVSATLETKDLATANILGATEHIARTLRIVTPVGEPSVACKPDEERGARIETKSFEYADDASKLYLKVWKDNDDGVAAAKGMAAFWKAGTMVAEQITNRLPPAAGKSGIGVGFVIDYLKKGGEILERLSTSPLTQRAMNVKVEVIIITSKVKASCAVKEVCRAGAWVTEKKPASDVTGEGVVRAVKRASKGDNNWGLIEVKRTPDLVDLDRLDDFAQAHLEAQIAAQATNKAAFDAWFGTCK